MVNEYLNLNRISKNYMYIFVQIPVEYSEKLKLKFSQLSRNKAYGHGVTEMKMHMCIIQNLTAVSVWDKFQGGDEVPVL